MAFGQPVETIYKLDAADVIVSLDADFLQSGYPGQTRYARDYAKRVWDNSGEDNVFFLAGGIAFNILLAAVPFVLLLVWGFALTLHNRGEANQLPVCIVFGIVQLESQIHVGLSFPKSRSIQSLTGGEAILYATKT